MDESLPHTPSTGIYMVAAHPDLRDSRVNRQLLAAAQAAAGVQLRDLYASYPDYDIDVAAEQAAAGAATLLVLLHPVQWYSMPALLKLWLDEVLAHGWAYGPGGTALQGKDLWLVATTGGAESSYHPQGYNRYFFDAFLPPYEQTAALCGMRFLPPLVLHGAHSASSDEVHAHVGVFRDRLQSYPQWPELEDLEGCPACEVPITDRPMGAPRAAGPPLDASGPSGGSPGASASSAGAL
ncbi:MAG: NAD(P)H dehydrogenase [Comamonadaceae bacterium]|nr:MAG: NAD(P)H dehydrogenase [Comamonadaceae bacterium]